MEVSHNFSKNGVSDNQKAEDERVAGSACKLDVVILGDGGSSVRWYSPLISNRCQNDPK
jgi:hypothetical protein